LTLPLRQNPKRRLKELRKQLGDTNKEIFRARAASQGARPGLALTGVKGLEDRASKLRKEIRALDKRLGTKSF
jgi:uncharacterized small protein (DUF1192 family)